VLRAAVGQARRWQDAGHFVRVAVNVSAQELMQADFAVQVEAALAEARLDGRWLELELTETAVMQGGPEAAERLAALKRLGVGLAIDDFGTGYSSLAHLKALPVGELKIDRSFVSRMCSDPTDSAIVYALIQLARKLDIRLVAEGVEDRWTWDALRVLDCDLIQGYLISRPLPAADIASQLESQRRQRLSSGVAYRHDQLNSQRRSIDRARIAV